MSPRARPGAPYDTHHSRTVSASVSVSADEVLDPMARQVRRGDPLILVSLDSQELTVDEARQVAAALTEAVDLVDARWVTSP